MKLKPDLTFFFSAMPGLNGIWMLHEYNKADSREELTNLAHKWMNEADETENTIRKRNYTNGYHLLFAFLTGWNFESKIVIENFDK